MTICPQKIQVDWDTQDALPEPPPLQDWAEISCHGDETRTFILVPRPPRRRLVTEDEWDEAVKRVIMKPKNFELLMEIITRKLKQGGVV